MSRRQRTSLANSSSKKFLDLDTSLGMLKVSEPQSDCTISYLSSEVMCVLVTPNEEMLIAGQMDGTLSVISIVNGSEEKISAHEAAVKCVAVTSNSYLLVTGSYDNTLAVWDLKRNSEVARLNGHTSHVFAVVISSDDKNAVSSSNDRTVNIWSLVEYRLETRIDGLNVIGYCLSLSLDNNLLVVGANDSTIRIWNFKEEREEAKLQGHDLPIYSVAITADKKTVISASIDKTMRKWNVPTCKQISILCESIESIKSLSLTSDDKYIVYGRYDGVSIASVSGDFEEFHLKGHSSMVNSVFVTRSSSYIASGSNDCTVRLCKLSDFPAEIILEGHKRDINNLDISQNGRYIASASHDHSVMIWNLAEKQRIGVLEGHTFEVYCVAFTQDERCVSGGADELLKVWDLVNFVELESLKGHEEAIRCVAVTPDDKRVVSGSMDHTIRIWSLINYEELHLLKGHESMVNCIVMRSKRSAISGSNDGTIRMWDIHKGLSVIVFTEHKAEISCMAITSNRRKLLCGGRDGKISIWNVKHKHFEFFLSSDKASVNKLCLSGDSQFLFTQHNNQVVMIWSLPDKQILGVLHSFSKMISLAVSKDNEWIVMSTQNKIRIVRSPLSEVVAYSVVPYNYSFLFKAQVHRLLNGKYKSLVQDSLKSVFLPWNVNLMHVISFMNYPKLLKSAISQNTKFLGSQLGETPLTVSLHRRSKLCAEILIKRIPKELFMQNPGIFEYIGEILNKLNKASLASLPLLYNSAFPLVTNQILPKFGKFKSKPPIILLSDSPVIESSNFLNLTENNEELMDVEIEFRQSMLKLNLEKGSEESIKFVKSLKICKNPEVFNSELVKVILLFKWRQVLPPLKLLSLVYMMLIVTLMVQTIIKDDRGSLIVIVALNTFFLFYEMAQLKMRAGSYFYSIWNWLDIIRIGILYAYAGVVFSGVIFSRGTLLAIANSLSWIRMIGFIRIFDRTRYLIRMCAEIVKSMGPFILIYFTAIFGTCLCYYSDSYSVFTFRELIVNVYSLSYGQFNNSNDTKLQTFVLVLASLILTLMLLNLIIALMGDVFQKVKGAITIADTKEMASIILEIDSIMWLKIRKQKSTRKYIQQCTLAESKTNKNDVTKETDEIMRLVQNIGQKYKVSENRLKEIVTVVDRVLDPEKNSTNEKIMDLLMEIKSDIKDTKKEMRLEMMKTKLDLAEIRKEAVKLKPK